LNSNQTSDQYLSPLLKDHVVLILKG